MTVADFFCRDIRSLAVAGLLCLLVAGTAAADNQSYSTRGLTGTPASERKTALVIGNAAYPYQPLRNPVNDARAMSQSLRSLGFEVISVENATSLDMQRAILKFADALTEGGAGVFYYAGHGLQVRGTNYLVPIDENITSEASVRFEAISLDAVLEQMGQPRPHRTNVVILDACRNNPYTSRYGGTGAGLALVDAPTDFLVAYAAAPGGVAVDGDADAGNGLYTSELLKAIKEPGLQIEDVFKRVRAGVSEKTRHAQIPWEASSLLRDFSFNTGPAATEPEPAPQVAVVQSQDERGVKSSRESQALELAFWDAIKNSQNAADYQAYLQAFPDGIFVPLAKARAARFEKSAAAPKAPSGPVVEEIESYYTAITGSNVREQPTAGSKRVGSVDAGARLLATGKVKDSNWYRIETPEGDTGYIFGDLIKRAAPGEASQPTERVAALPVPEAATPSPAAKIAPEPKASKPEPSPSKSVGASSIEPSFAEATPAPQAPKESAVATAAATVPAVKIPEPEPEPQIQPAVGVFPSQPGNSFKDCAECPEMVEITPGSFTMGSRSDRTEQPPHSVTIRNAFAIGKYEVTHSEWNACVADGVCPELQQRDGMTDRMPVRGVSWTDTESFLTWLREKSGKDYRLPTEAEWEYAARGGSATDYWWGDAIGSGNANCQDCGGVYDRKNPMEVGLYPPNPFGVHDTNGGVWEWVGDCWHDDFSGAPSDGSAWSSPDCRQRVLRGGSWRNDASYARSSSRFFYDATVRYSVNGFRVAVSLQ